jgi:glycerophosphoryl diester phosphodiesterase
MSSTSPAPSADRDRSVAPVIGHRGAGVLAPENTLAALRTAASIGLRWVEIDVQVTADGTCVLFHDWTLERTTDGHGVLADLPLSHLRGLDAGGWFGAAFRGEPVPTLIEAIACLGALGLGVNVEIKCRDGDGREHGERVGRCLAEHWPDRRPPPIVSSFDDRALAAASGIVPSWPRALIVAEIPEDWPERAGHLRISALHCAADRIDPDAALRVRRAGLRLRAYTVDDPKAAARLCALGVESVFTDRPDVLLSSPPRPGRPAVADVPTGGDGRP